MKHPEGIANIFPTQIGTYHLDLDKELINSVMQDYKIGPLQALDRGNTSFALGAASDFGFHPYAHFLFDSRLADLVQNIQFKLNQYTNDLYLEPCKITNSWFNKMDTDGSVRMHRHNGSVVSGALYINVPDNSSPLVFMDPLNGFKMMELSRRRFQYEVDIEEGLLLFFPSWLLHETFAQKKPRTVISFNTYHAPATSL